MMSKFEMKLDQDAGWFDDDEGIGLLEEIPVLTSGYPYGEEGNSGRDYYPLSIDEFKSEIAEKAKWHGEVQKDGRLKLSCNFEVVLDQVGDYGEVELDMALSEHFPKSNKYRNEILSIINRDYPNILPFDSATNKEISEENTEMSLKAQKVH